MRYVILRDDDTSAFTPVACLERLYRPFLNRGLPVNLAVIPEVRTTVCTPDGRREGFLTAGYGPDEPIAPIGGNRALLDYLRAESGYEVVQHGCHHDYFEFGTSDRAELVRRLNHGTRCLRDAGLTKPVAFVAPYDRLSRTALLEVAARFNVISTGWFEIGRVPVRWLPEYAAKKLRHQPHWRVGRVSLLSHPGCLLSFHRPYADMLASVQRVVENSSLTVLVTHWWEYFRDGTPDEKLIDVLHEVAAWLGAQREVRVVTFRQLANGEVPLN
jgi:hypothetical protein